MIMPWAARVETDLVKNKITKRKGVSFLLSDMLLIEDCGFGAALFLPKVPGKGGC
jgi:hypothetical protein